MDTSIKESCNLLGLSSSDSDSRSEVPEFIVAPPPPPPARKKRLKRRLRSSSISQRFHDSQACHCRGRTVGLTIAVVVLLGWLVIVSWLAAALHSELKHLDENVRGVVAGSQGVPDALQKCHSVSKELQENQTAIFKRIATLTQDLENFTTQLTTVQTSLRSVEDQLKAAPELVSVPKDLQELKNSVASFGSQIRDLDSRVTSVKDQNGKLQDLSSGLLQNLTSLRSLVDLLSNHSQQLQPSLQDRDAEKVMLTTINELVRNLSSVNTTLSKKIQWTTDDQRPDHAAIQNLKDSFQNVSARLRTLEEKCADYTNNEAALQSTLTRLIVQSNNSVSHWQDLGSQLLQIKSQYNELADNVTEVRNMLGNIQQTESAQMHQYAPTTRDLEKVTTSYGGVGIDGSMETTSKYSAR